MKTEPELYQFYKTNLVKTLRVLEEDRKKIVHKIITYISLILGITVILFIIFYIKSLPVYAYIVVGVIAGIIGTFVYKSVIKPYTLIFKDNVIEPIVKFVDSSLKYEKTNYIPQSTFKSSAIFKHKIDRYKGDDYVKGKIGETEIEFSELHAEYKTETRDSKGHRRTQWHTIFKGLFFIGDFNKEFSGRTVVLPDTAQKFLGRLGQKLQSMNFTRDNLIKLEDPEFEKLFVVYSTDQVESRYILSSSLMQRIVEFQKKTNKNICLSFIASKVFVAISYKRDLFEPKIFNTLLDFTPIREYFSDLNTAIGIVEDLNLNLRIWTKE